MRTVASQMADARGQTVSLRIGATAATGEDVEFGVSGTVITFRGFLAAYEEGRDEAPEEDEERPLPHLKVGDAVQAALARAAGPRDLAAGPLHGADAGQGAGGLRHRPPVDVRVDPRDDPRPRIRREARAGARADVPGVRRDEAARAALRQARRLRLHGADGGRSRPHRRRRGAAGRLADAVLPRRERRARSAHHGHGAPRRDRCPRGELDRAAAQRHRRAGRPVRAVPGARRFSVRPCRTRSRPTSSPPRRPRSCWRGRRRSARSATTRRRAAPCSCATAATGRTSPRSSPRTRTKSRRLHRCSRRCRPRRSRWTRR